MSKGFVYVLSNPSMPGIVKVGMTTRTVEGRAAELFQTGVPTPFVIEHSVFCPDCCRLEEDVHRVLESDRVAASREFFACDVPYAINVVDQCHIESLSSYVAEFTEHHRLIEDLFYVDEADIFYLAEYTGAHPAEIVGAISRMLPEEIAPALERYRQKRGRFAPAEMPDGAPLQ